MTYRQDSVTASRSSCRQFPQYVTVFCLLDAAENVNILPYSRDYFLLFFEKRDGIFLDLLMVVPSACICKWIRRLCVCVVHAQTENLNVRARVCLLTKSIPTGHSRRSISNGPKTSKEIVYPLTRVYEYVRVHACKRMCS